MSGNIKVLETSLSFKKKIEQAMLQEIKDRITKNKKKAERQIASLVPSWALASPEVQSLAQDGIAGSLHAQFGLFRGTGDIVANDIANAVAKSVSLEVNFTKSLKGTSVTFFIQPTDFTNLLEIPLGEIRTAIGDVLPWMRWLLLEGTRTIVSSYAYEPDNSGRSGGGTMRLGGIWRVPPQFSGTASENFVTRMFENKDKQIQPILKGLLL